MNGEFIHNLQRNLFSRGKSNPDGGTDTGPVYLIVGLGNPGRDYKDTRHNMGFMVVDTLAKSLGINLTRVQQKAITGQGKFGAAKVLLAKPQTYMNLSGKSVAALVRFYKVPVNQVLIVHDDLDLPFGTLRMRAKGSSAGQKGVQSILERLSTLEVPRLRVGIGRPSGSKQGANYVLKTFSPEERKELEYILDRAARATQVFIESGIDTAMNQFNGSILEE